MSSSLPDLSSTPSGFHHSTEVLERERRAHEAFAATRRYAYVERTATVEALDTLTAPLLLNAHSRSPMAPILITGEAGSGKSALIAWWTERYRTRRPNPFIITHYIGASTEGDDHLSLLRRVMLEIRHHYSIDEEPPTFPEQIVSDFPLWLGRVRGEPLLLAIDALDQLPSSIHLNWLPDYLPPSICCIASTRNEASAGVLIERGWRELCVEPLEPNERRQVIRRYLADSPGEFPRVHTNRLAAMPGGANPLFLRTSMEELRTARRLGLVADLDEAPTTLDALYNTILRHLENEHGQAVTSAILSALWCSRHGLSREELYLLTGESARIATFLRAADCHLYRRNGLVTFFHDILRTTVEARYLPHEEAQRSQHCALGEFFASHTNSERRASEEPWQWQAAREPERLALTLTSPEVFENLYTDAAKYELMGYWQLPELRSTMAASYSQSLNALDIPQKQMAHQKRMVGMFLLDCGEYEGARTMLDEALHLTRQNSAESEQVAAYAALGRFYHAFGEYEQGSAYYRNAIEAAREAERLDRNELYLGLGACLYASQSLAEARDVFETILSTETVPAHTMLSVLNNLAATKVQMGDVAEALVIFEQAYALSAEYWGTEHPETATVLGNIGQTRRRLGDVSGAEEALRQALRINQQTLGPSHPRTALDCANLGVQLREELRFEEALEFLKQALDIRRQAFGDDHFQVTATALRMARVCREMGNLMSAAELYVKYIPRVAAAHSRSHPIVQSSLEGYRTVLKALGDEPSDSPIAEYFNPSTTAPHP